MTAINITNPSSRHKIQIDEEYIEDVTKLLMRRNQPCFRVSTYFDMVLMQDCELGVAVVMQIKQKGSCLVGV
jgi:hypothetical protein